MISLRTRSLALTRTVRPSVLISPPTALFNAIHAATSDIRGLILISQAVVFIVINIRTIF